MASMAAIGVMRPPSSSSLSSSSSSNLSRRTAFRSLSFSSSSNLSGGKVCSTAFSVRRDTGRNERTPMIVSPKAVSDSRNSQTCLDPDASRVSFLLHLLLLLLLLLILLLLLLLLPPPPPPPLNLKYRVIILCFRSNFLHLGLIVTMNNYD